MSRLLFRAAAALACMLATTGCASQSPSEQAAANSAADADAGPYGAIAKNLPTNLDGEIRRAQLLRAAGDLAGATRSLSQLMLVAPDDPRVVGEYGKVLAQQGRSADALAFLNRAIELQPDNWTLYSALGVTYDQSDERKKAADAYKHALALKPDEPTVLNNYAISQMLAGDLDRADQLLHQAAANGGNYPKIAANLEMIAAMRAKNGGAGPESALRPATAVAKAHPATPAPRLGATAIAHEGQPRALQPVTAYNRPNKTSPKIVMQKVPYDPLAGKIYGAHAKPAPHRLAKAPDQPDGKAEPRREAAKRTSPALRTAADIY